MTLGDRLASVQNAIAKIEDPSVQEYTIDGRTLKRPDLNALYRKEERLLKDIAIHGADYSPLTAKPANRKARVVIGY